MKLVVQALNRARQPPGEGGPPLPPLDNFLPATHSLMTHGSVGAAHGPGAPPATPFGQASPSE